MGRAESGILKAKNSADTDGFCCSEDGAAWGGGGDAGSDAGVARDDTFRDAPGTSRPGEEGFCGGGAALISSYSCKRAMRVGLLPFVERPRSLASLRRATTVSFSHVRDSKTVETNVLCNDSRRVAGCRTERSNMFKVDARGQLGGVVSELPRGDYRSDSPSQ